VGELADGAADQAQPAGEEEDREDGDVDRHGGVT
jgi:hypothetical protein